MLSQNILYRDHMDNICDLLLALDARIAIKIPDEGFVFDPRYNRSGLFGLLATLRDNKLSPFAKEPFKFTSEGNVYYDGMTPFNRCTQMFSAQFMQIIERDTKLAQMMVDIAEKRRIPVEALYMAAVLEVVGKFCGSPDEVKSMMEGLVNFHKVAESHSTALLCVAEHVQGRMSPRKAPEQAPEPQQEASPAPTAPLVAPDRCTGIVGELTAFVAYVDSLSPQAKEYLKLSAAQTRAKSVIKLLG